MHTNIKIYILILSIFLFKNTNILSKETNEYIIETFNSISDFQITSNQGGTYKIKSIPGKKQNAIAIDFELPNNSNNLVISKAINIKTSQDFSFSFWIMGTSKNNNLELRIIDKNGNMFFRKWENLDLPKTWQLFNVSKKDFIFAYGPNPMSHIEEIEKIEIDISNYKDSSKGTIYLDDLKYFDITPQFKNFMPIVTASSSQSKEHGPDKAIDGNNTTYWNSDFLDNQWLKLDLKNIEDISGFVINWNTNYAKKYEIIISSDGINWSRVFFTDNSSGGIEEITFQTKSCRYIRFNLISKATRWGFSINEIRIKGKDESILIQSSNDIDLINISNIMDGDINTSWHSTINNEQWILLDQQKPKSFSELLIIWDNDYAQSYEILTSNDMKKWKCVYFTNTGNGEKDRIYIQGEECRYIKLFLKQSSTGRGYGIKEINLRQQYNYFSLTTFFEIAAENSPEGYYPPYFLKKTTKSFPIGVINDEKIGIINEQGAISVEKDLFTIEPFLLLNNKIITYKDVKLSQKLEKGYLPIPKVNWDTKDINLEIMAFADGLPKNSQIIVRYKITNLSNISQSGNFLLTIRPFKIPLSFNEINFTNLIAKIKTISYAENCFLVNKEKRIIPLIKPDNFGTTKFDFGEIINFISKGEIPSSKDIFDPKECASGVISYSFNIDEGESKDFYFIIPFYENLPDIKIANDPKSVQELISKRLQDNINLWSARLSLTDIKLPRQYTPITNLLRSYIGYILILQKEFLSSLKTTNNINPNFGNAASIVSALLRLGLSQEAKDFALCYLDIMSNRKDVNDGEIIYIISQIYSITKDKLFLNQHMEDVIKSAENIIQLRSLRKTDEYLYASDEKHMLYGIIPEKININESITYTPMHPYIFNFWAIKGLKEAVYIMGIANRFELKEKYEKEVNDFRNCIINSIKYSIKLHKIDYIPAIAELGNLDTISVAKAIWPCGEYPYLPQKELNSTFQIYYKDRQDMQNNSTKLKEDDLNINEVQNITAFLYLNKPEKAHMLFNNLINYIKPWGLNKKADYQINSEIDVANMDISDISIAAELVNSIKSFFIIEDEEKGSIYIGKGIKEEWLSYPNKDGIVMRNIPTIWGNININISKIADSITILIEGKCNPPNNIYISLPINKSIRRVTLNNSPWSKDNNNEILVKELPSKIVIYY